MITLWTSKETQPNTYGGSGRWTLRVCDNGMSLGFYREYRNLEENLDWQTSHSAVYEIALHKKFEISRDHCYYDGPHCFMTIGWVKFTWCGNPFTGWCEKCMPSGKKKTSFFKFHDG